MVRGWPWKVLEGTSRTLRKVAAALPGGPMPAAPDTGEMRVKRKSHLAGPHLRNADEASARTWVRTTQEPRGRALTTWGKNTRLKPAGRGIRVLEPGGGFRNRGA